MTLICTFMHLVYQPPFPKSLEMIIFSKDYKYFPQAICFNLLTDIYNHLSLITYCVNHLMILLLIHIKLHMSHCSVFIRQSQSLTRFCDQCSPKVTVTNEQLSLRQEIFLLEPLLLWADCHCPYLPSPTGPLTSVPQRSSLILCIYTWIFSTLNFQL